MIIRLLKIIIIFLIEKLMEYINNDEILNEKIKLKYSTLNEYFNEKEKDLISINNI